MIKAKRELNHIRIKSGYSMTGLAKATGFTPQFISGMIRGAFGASPEAAKKICDALQVEFDEIFTIEG